MSAYIEQKKNENWHFQAFLWKHSCWLPDMRYRINVTVLFNVDINISIHKQIWETWSITRGSFFSVHLSLWDYHTTTQKFRFNKQATLNRKFLLFVIILIKLVAPQYQTRKRIFVDKIHWGGLNAENITFMWGIFYVKLRLSDLYPINVPIQEMQTCTHTVTLWVNAGLIC